MGTFVYDNAANNFVSGQIVWTALPVNVALLDGNYQPKTTDVFLNQIPSYAIIRRDIAMTSLGVTADFIAHGIIPEVQALISTYPIAAIIFYNKTGNDATSDLLYYSSDAIGMPVTPRGLNWQWQFNQLRRGFFKVQ